MKKFLGITIFLIFIFIQNAESASKRILVFAGAASKPATEEGAQIFKEISGIPVDVVFGGSGFILSQMKLTRRGDLYFPGSSDFMELAKKEGLVFPESEKILVYLIPAINVQKGNPKKIYSLKDLSKKGIRVAIANPEMVCVGTYAVEIIETIYLKPEEIPRIGYIPIAISKFTQDKISAQKFIDFLLSSQGKTIFRKYHYSMDPQEARRFTKPDTPIGGEYSLPEEWRSTKK